MKMPSGFKVKSDRKIIKSIKLDDKFHYFQRDDGRFILYSNGQYLVSDDKYDYISSGNIGGILYMLLISGNVLGAYQVTRISPILMCSVRVRHRAKPMYAAGQQNMNNGLPGLMYSSEDKNFVVYKILYNPNAGLVPKSYNFVTKNHIQISDTIPSIVSQDGIDTVLTIKNGEINI